MIDEDSLNVWFGDRLVGYLWRDGSDRLGFQYAPEWLPNGFRLSVQLPLRAEPYGPEQPAARFFFSNLLPEGEARRRLLRARRISDSDFLLLREFGGDCAGALSVLPVEAAPTAGGGYTALSDDALHELVLQRAWTAYAQLTAVGKPRLSLAGAQDKCPVMLHDGVYSLPHGAAASSHILKFRVPDYPDVPLYEVFMSRLAGATGLQVAETRVDAIRGERFLVVTRYDRYAEGGEIRRLHQEDFYQALGPQFRDKYQEFGGPSLVDCVQLLREVSEDPVSDIQSLIRWQAFNVLAGNSDGHAKNLALVQVQAESERWRLAPFYDLVCTRALEGVDKTLGMAVGGEFDPDRVSRDHWRQFARDAGLSPRFVLAQVAHVAARLSAEFEAASSAFQAETGGMAEVQDRVGAIVRAQCERLV